MFVVQKRGGWSYRDRNSREKEKGNGFGLEEWRGYGIREYIVIVAAVLYSVAYGNLLYLSIIPYVLVHTTRTVAGKSLTLFPSPIHTNEERNEIQ
jgi:hypothetical protein